MQPDQEREKQTSRNRGVHRECVSLFSSWNCLCLMYLSECVDGQVGPKDTLNSIALKFNITPNKLVQLNRLYSHSVVPGQVRFLSCASITDNSIQYIRINQYNLKHHPAHVLLNQWAMFQILSIHSNLLFCHDSIFRNRGITIFEWKYYKNVNIISSIFI